MLTDHWVDINTVSEALGVSTARVRQFSLLAYRDIQKFQYVRKVLMGGTGVERWEWREDFLEATIKERTAKKRKRKGVSGRPVNDPKIYAIESPKALPSINTHPEVGFYMSLEDGSILERFSPEMYEQFRSNLIEHPILRERVQGHSEELVRLQTTYDYQIQNHSEELIRLQTTYEDHIQTYVAQTDYLRRSLENTQELLGKVIDTLKDKTLIEAGELMLKAKSQEK